MDDLEDPGAGLDVRGRGEGDTPGLAAGELDQGGGAELLVSGPVPSLALNTSDIRYDQNKRLPHTCLPQ